MYCHGHHWNRRPDSLNSEYGLPPRISSGKNKAKRKRRMISVDLLSYSPAFVDFFFFLRLPVTTGAIFWSGSILIQLRSYVSKAVAYPLPWLWSACRPLRKQIETYFKLICGIQVIQIKMANFVGASYSIFCKPFSVSRGNIEYVAPFKLPNTTPKQLQRALD